MIIIYNVVNKFIILVTIRYFATILLMVLFFFICNKSYSQNIIELPTVTISAEKERETCLKDASIKAQSYADLKRSEILTELQHESAIKGAGLAVVCSVFSIAVWGLDGGILTGACIAGGTAIGGGNYLLNSKSTHKKASDAFDTAFEKKSEELKKNVMVTSMLQLNTKLDLYLLLT